MNADTVNQQVQELEKLRRQARRTSLAIVVAVSTIVIVGVGAIIASVHSLAAAGPKQDEFIKQLGSRVQAEVLPTVKHVVEPSLRRLGPSVETELQRVNERAPQVANVALRELNLLGASLTEQSTTILNQTVGRELQKREARLHKLYPAASDQQIVTLVENLHLELQDQVGKTSDRIFNPHINAIQNIMDDVEDIRQTEPINPHAEVNPWQVAFLFLDVFTQEFHDLAVNDAANPQEFSK